MPLFNSGKFTLHSGQTADFKIDCDALSDEDWYALGEQLARRLPSYSAVVGIPTGGIKLAGVMKQWTSPNKNDPILIVDDVLTTGVSMSQMRVQRRGQVDAIGAVVFARGPVPDWIVPLFRLEPCGD